MKAVGLKRFDFLFNEVERIDLIDQGNQNARTPNLGRLSRGSGSNAPAFSRHHSDDGRVAAA